MSVMDNCLCATQLCRYVASACHPGSAGYYPCIHLLALRKHLVDADQVDLQEDPLT